MAVAGMCRISQFLRTFKFFKFPINEVVNKNVNLVLSRNLSCSTHLYSKNDFVSQSKSSNEYKKRKSTTSPAITLITPENEVVILALEEAQKWATRRNLKLVKIIDVETKSKKPTFKLMTNQEYFQESLKAKEQKKKEKGSVVKESKWFTMATKISEHDLYIKINQIIKLLKKKHEVRVSLSSDGNAARMQELVTIIEGEVKDLIDKKSSTTKGSNMRMSFIPKIEIENDSNNENKEGKIQQHDNPEETITKLEKG